MTERLPDMSAMSTVDAIVFYTREVSEVLAIRPGTPGRTERLQALLEWKQALIERIERERNYVDIPNFPRMTAEINRRVAQGVRVDRYVPVNPENPRFSLLVTDEYGLTYTQTIGGRIVNGEERYTYGG